MNTVLGMLLCDVKSPLRASKLSINWISLSFFIQKIKYQEQLPDALGRK